MPVYNGEKYIKEAIDSILAQTFKDFELIICDNASTDNTQAICESFQDNRIKYFRNTENMGAAWNYNHAEDLACGEYFKWAAHDDVLAPEFLAECVDALDSHPNAVMAYTWIEKIDAHGQSLGIHRDNLATSAKMPSIRYSSLILKDHYCVCFFGLIRKEKLQGTARHGNYNSADRVFLAHMGLRGKLYEIPKNLFYWRRHPEQSLLMTKDRYAYALWFDPKNAGQAVYPKKRLFQEYYRLLALEKENLNGVNRVISYLSLSLWLLLKSPQIVKEIMMGGVK